MITVPRVYVARLEKRIEELETARCALAREWAKQEKRIEAAGGDNLERNIEMLRDRGAKLTEQDKWKFYGTLITDEQIDAAWIVATSLEPDAIDTLKELGIERCVTLGCESGMYTEGRDDGSDTLTRACEGCNGHRWVKK
jgi:hypothetical protein